MRRLLLAPALTGLLLVTACGAAGNEARQTVIVTNTVTGSVPTTAPTLPSTPGSSIQVGDPTADPSETVEDSSGEATSPSAPSSAPSRPDATGVPVAGINPMLAACDRLLDADDVEQTLGFTLRPGSVKRPDQADPARDVTDRSRCRYGSEDEGRTGQVTVLLTTYGAADSAAKQVATTLDVERNEGAAVSDVVVDGFPGHLMLRQGGLLVVQYGSWTLTLAVQDGLADEDALATGLPELGSIVLKRLVANG